jgi:hypothetical protein
MNQLILLEQEILFNQLHLQEVNSYEAARESLDVSLRGWVPGCQLRGMGFWMSV